VKEIIMPTPKKTSDPDSNVTEVSDDTTSVQSAVSSTEGPAVEENVTLEQRANNEVANDVLHGRFGDFNVVRKNLEKAGTDVTAIMTIVNDRLAHGAPASYRPNVTQVLDSARLGEWGNTNVGLRVRAAGYSELDAQHVETSLNQES
jgi:hypothetical protein